MPVGTKTADIGMYEGDKVPVDTKKAVRRYVRETERARKHKQCVRRYVPAKRTCPYDRGLLNVRAGT